MAENKQEAQDIPYQWELDEEENLVEKYSEELEDGDKLLTYRWVLWEQFEAASKQTHRN